MKNMLENSNNFKDTSIYSGLCDKNMYKRFLEGERNPNYFLRDRIYGRMRVYYDGIEEYIYKDEYDIYMKMEDITEELSKKNFTKVKKEVEDFLNKNANNNILKQYALDIQGRIFYENNEIWNAMCKFKEALMCTIPKITIANIKKISLSVEEIYLYARYIECVICCSDIEDREIIKSLELLIDKAENSGFNKVQIAKIYPLLSLIYLKATRIWNIDMLSKETSDMQIKKSLKILRDSHRGYYLIDVLDNYLEIKEKTNNNISSELNEDAINYELLRDCLKEIYLKYNIDCNFNLDTYIHNNHFVYEIGGIIRSRRQALNLTQEELAKDICTKKTIVRIENGQGRIQDFAFKKIFEKLKLYDGHIRGAIVMEKPELVFDASFLGNGDKLIDEDSFDKIMSDIDKKYSINKQTLIRIASERLLARGQIDIDHHIRNLEKALEQTINIEDIVDQRVFLSKYELTCIYLIAYYKQRENKKIDENDFYKILRDLYVNMGEREARKNSAMYEMVLTWLSSIYGNCGRYEESDNLADNVIKTSLIERRLQGLETNIYSILWNRLHDKRTLLIEEKNELENLAVIAKYNKNNSNAECIQKFVYDHNLE